MACDLATLPQQTPAQRRAEVQRATRLIDQLIAQKRARVIVGRQGAIAFEGISDTDRARMTDACIYRSITRTGSRAAQLEIQRAEQLAGRAVDRAVIAAGVHSHDGGKNWSTH